jgi:hypothetical protein
MVAVAATGCEDPVLREREKSLGPDTGAYPEGPYHRAGDPCTWCHTEGGSADPLDLAGTVYARKRSKEPLEGVVVRLFDRAGRQATLRSNLAGNFFFEQEELPLSFPLWVQLEYEGEVTAMQTPIRRERSCAACHRDPASPSSVGHVFLSEQE